VTAKAMEPQYIQRLRDQNARSFEGHRSRRCSSVTKHCTSEFRHSSQTEDLHHHCGQSGVAAFCVQLAAVDDGGLSAPELMPHAVGIRDPTNAGHGAKQLSNPAG
jgi:hypothetical protein